MPKPRSVKFKPLRTVRPTPSYFTQRKCSRLTPPCSMRSSIKRPMALSASAVMMAVSKPKQRRSPRATLYSPPPSHARNSRAVLMRMSPGSRRSITSPRLTRSNLHSSLLRSFIGPASQLRSLRKFLRLQCPRGIDEQPRRSSQHSEDGCDEERRAPVPAQGDDGRNLRRQHAPKLISHIHETGNGAGGASRNRGGNRPEGALREIQRAGTA